MAKSTCEYYSVIDDRRQCRSMRDAFDLGEALTMTFPDSVLDGFLYQVSLSFKKPCGLRRTDV